MKRLLKIKEFFHLKKRASLAKSDDTGRPAKRPRKVLKYENESETARPSNNVIGGPEDRLQKFLDLFEEEAAKDIVWWLPGRRGEAFALNRQRFEYELLKTKFQEQSFATFLGNLNKWGYRQMNIPSLSDQVLAFESTSQSVAGWRAGARSSNSGLKSRKIKQQQQRPGSRQNRQDSPTLPGYFNVGQRRRRTHEHLANRNNFADAHSEQAQYMVQQEIMQDYVSLLWQELQRQLTVAFFHQDSASTQASHRFSYENYQYHPPGSQQYSTNTREHSISAQQSPRSVIADVASLLHQQQFQQQLAAAGIYSAAPAPIRQSTDQRAIIRELSDLHQQQLSNLTYQTMALVAANLESQNNHIQATQSPLMQIILDKYLITLVLLQLQQQQHGLELLRQEKQSALELKQSVERSSGAAPGRPSDASLRENTNSISPAQMQQLLAEAAMLSLSRAHQLLLEAAVLISPAEQPRSPRRSVSRPSSLHR